MAGMQVAASICYVATSSCAMTRNVTDIVDVGESSAVLNIQQVLTP